MDHADYLVDLVDEHGAAIGSKPRRDIQKKADLYHTVFVLLRTPDNRLILSEIPARHDLPNLYAGRLAATAATIRRHQETSEEAAKRAASSELRLAPDALRLTNLDDSYRVTDGYRQYVSVYVATHDVPADFNHTDIKRLALFTRDELDEAIRTDAEAFAPTFRVIWQTYADSLLAAA